MIYFLNLEMQQAREIFDLLPKVEFVELFWKWL